MSPTGSRRLTSRHITEVRAYHFRGAVDAENASEHMIVYVDRFAHFESVEFYELEVQMRLVFFQFRDHLMNTSRFTQARNTRYIL